MAGPLTNVTLKSIVLMYLLSLGPSSDPGHSLEASGPLSLWDWVCGHLLSPCCMGTTPPAPTLSVSQLIWLASLRPHIILYTPHLVGGQFVFYFQSVYPKNSYTLTEKLGYAESFVLCWFSGEGAWPKAQREDSWMPIPSGKKGHLASTPLSSHLSVGFLSTLWLLLGLPWQVGCLGAGWPSAHSLFTMRG